MAGEGRAPREEQCLVLLCIYFAYVSHLAFYYCSFLPQRLLIVWLCLSRISCPPRCVLASLPPLFSCRCFSKRSWVRALIWTVESDFPRTLALVPLVFNICVQLFSYSSLFSLLFFQYMAQSNAVDLNSANSLLRCRCSKFLSVWAFRTFSPLFVNGFFEDIFFISLDYIKA